MKYPFKIIVSVFVVLLLGVVTMPNRGQGPFRSHVDASGQIRFP